MALIVEDGTVVAGATSMASVAQADAYFAARGDVEWPLLTGAGKEAALVRASASLADATRYPFRGSRTGGYAQRQPWPRTGAVERHGEAIPANAMPWQVVDATCYLAGLAAQGDDLTPALARGGRVKSESVGPISTTYADDAPAGTVYQAAYGILKPLLRGDDNDELLPQWENSDPLQFDVGMHDNPGAFGVIE